MYISRATCISKEFGKTEYVICTENNDELKSNYQSDSVVLFVHLERPIADEILKAASLERVPVHFSCNDIDYQLISYHTNRFERYYNKYRKNHVEAYEKRLSSTIIHVYSQRCRCVRCYAKYGFDSIISICGGIPLAKDKSRKVDVDVQKCTRCNSYFIEAQSLREYEKKYGGLLVQKEFITGNEVYHDETDTWYYNSDSILSRNGYSTKLDQRTRRAVLANMMETGVAKAEIKDKLSEFIYFRGERCPNAKVIWQSDLFFVNNYNIENQSKTEFY